MSKYNVISFNRNDFIVARMPVSGGKVLVFDDGLACIFDGKEIYSGDMFKDIGQLTFIRKKAVLEVPFGWKGAGCSKEVQFVINMPALFLEGLPFETYSFRDSGVDYVLAHYDAEHRVRGAADYIRGELIDKLKLCGDTVAVRAGEELAVEKFLNGHGLVCPALKGGK